MKKIFPLLVLALAFGVPADRVAAHCQVPCGIFADDVRISLMEEHITTIEKGMNEIIKLSQEGEKNYNQIVRWVTNKDDHADELTEIVTYYFMAQRIKPDAEKYNEKLALLHQIMVSAMKAKQSTDLAHIEQLRSQVKAFSEIYFTKEDVAHLDRHSEQEEAAAALPPLKNS